MIERIIVECNQFISIYYSESKKVILYTKENREILMNKLKRNELKMKSEKMKLLKISLLLIIISLIINITPFALKNKFHDLIFYLIIYFIVIPYDIFNYIFLSYLKNQINDLNLLFDAIKNNKFEGEILENNNSNVIYIKDYLKQKKLQALYNQGKIDLDQNLKPNINQNQTGKVLQFTKKERT